MMLALTLSTRPRLSHGEELGGMFTSGGVRNCFRLEDTLNPLLKPSQGGAG